jgi:hypothetical protein
MNDDKRINYDVSVTLHVLAEPRQESDVEKTVLNYLRDYVPDEGPKDPIHIYNFQIQRVEETKTIEQQKVELEEAKAAVMKHIEEGVAKGIQDWMRNYHPQTMLSSLSLADLKTDIMAAMPVGLKGA